MYAGVTELGLSGIVDPIEGSFARTFFAAPEPALDVSVVIATRDAQVIGFAGYECTRKAFFGPTGVAEHERGRGIGTALLIACLWGLRELGYVYAVIGGAGPTNFYERSVGAIVIPDSEPGIYADLLKKSRESR